jgi:uncharacterized membrane protein (DUF373 family)
LGLFLVIDLRELSIDDVARTPARTSGLGGIPRPRRSREQDLGSAFQTLFGTIMTLLIAMEFKHSIIPAALRQESVVQVKTVILIALLALSRKFIILDTAATQAATIGALAGATLVLGIVYWLLRERDDRSAVSTHDTHAR